MDTLNDEDNGPVAGGGSLVGRVLADFIDTLAQEADLAEVAARLRDALIDNEERSEAAIRSALFESDTP
ncbi:hypothetical protein [Caulobacter sp. 17J80-11]|uniref:hypothetical protein n=1 Tax=Caulobacter sp. 17J80-11 TaxID=2763502 RepID=UPI0016538408|nr:hypothetical protein [Caulobacter sp. 17J80-11]MBC6983353.1 hypothetical protein [Caulobacter sp. 17J80-11]